MGKAKKRPLWKNRNIYKLKIENEKVEQNIIHPKKDLHTIKNKNEKNLPLTQNLINVVMKFQCMRL